MHKFWVLSNVGLTQLSEFSCISRIHTVLLMGCPIITHETECEAVMGKEMI